MTLEEIKRIGQIMEAHSLPVDPIAYTRRPFVIREHRGIVSFEVDHLLKGSLQMTLKHEHEGELGVSFPLETAIELRDVLDALIEEQARNSIHITMTTTRF